MREIEASRKKRLGKSYALVEMATEEAKKATLKQDFRVLGINICRSLCQLEDADYKRSLIITCLPYGIQISDAFDFLSYHLSSGSRWLIKPASASSRFPKRKTPC